VMTESSSTAHVFICGLKEAKSGMPMITAEGVLEEYESAKRFDRIAVPIGASGGAAEVIWPQQHWQKSSVRLSLHWTSRRQNQRP
jgi:hypothetical protein